MIASRYIIYSSWFIILLCLSVLVGWQLDVDRLVRVAPGLPAMNPFTATGFIAIAAWQLLRLRQRQSPEPFHSIALPFLAGVVLFIGIQRTFAITTEADFSIDAIIGVAVVKHGRISPPTAFCFILSGLAMIPGGSRLLGRNFILWLVVPMFIASYLSIFGYFIGFNTHTRMSPLIPMAFHTAAAFIITSFTLLFNYPGNSFVNIWMGNNFGGAVARRLLPYVFLVPTMLGIARFYGERKGYYDTGFGVALIAVTFIAVMVIVVLRQSFELGLIDARRHAAEEEALQQAAEVLKRNEELRLKNKELESFTYAASHDLKEPVRKIHFFADLLQSRLSNHPDEEAQKSLQRIQLSTRRMHALIDDLLSYAQVSNEKMLKEKVDLNLLLRRVLEDLDLEITERGATIELGPLPQVYGHSHQLTQLFQNLLSNALKYGRSGLPPQVSITAEERREGEREFVKITIADNGIGIAEEDRERVFELFTRLQNNGPARGTGIGLAIVKKIADNHHALVDLESEEGKGSRFSVSFLNENHLNVEQMNRGTRNVEGWEIL